MTYVDGFVVPVPSDKKQAYIDAARSAAEVMREHGALQVIEAWADDVKPGKLTSFPQSVDLRDGETVVFGWILWPSREIRDAGWGKAMEDPRMGPMGPERPFDGARMIYGGFEVIFDG